MEDRRTPAGDIPGCPGPAPRAFGQRHRLLVMSVGVAFSALLPACFKHPFVPPATGSGGPPSPPPVSWSQDVWPILQLNCQACHTGSGSGAVAVPDMLMTDAPTLYPEWVRKVSDCTANLQRVLPLDAGTSLVYLLVSTLPNPCGSGLQDHSTLILVDEQRTIQTWINQGANEN